MPKLETSREMVLDMMAHNGLGPVGVPSHAFEDMLKEYSKESGIPVAELRGQVEAELELINCPTGFA